MSLVQALTMRRFWRVYAFHAEDMCRKSFKVLAYNREEAQRIHKNLNSNDIIISVGEWEDD